MRKLSVLFFIAFSTALMIAGCGKDEEPSKPAAVVDEEVKPEKSTEEEPVEKEETEEQDVAPAGKVQSNLTGEWIDKDLADQRPMAVMINNIIDAIPQSGIGKADILYEASVEGNLTRLMAIIEDWRDIEKLGPVRSCRDYYVYWAYEWDAIYAHFGGPHLYVDDVLGRDYTDNLDGTALDGTAYYRTTDRKAPHNAYASGESLLKGIDVKGYYEEHTDFFQPNHYLFSTYANPTDLSAASGSIDAARMEPGYPVNKPYFEYNEEDGLYYRYQYGEKHIDVETGDQLAFQNVIFQNTYSEVRDPNGYLAFQCHDDTKDGYYFTGGKAIPITWEKTSDFAATRYYDKDGKEIKLNKGKTMICIIQDGDKDKVKIK